ncbi:hypothetical protein M0813_00059 [Anaeramoeba flamelloides]|uniref:Uncharacterized protein n=1 Tax=Anaeramoeba flamelloides TaxID=1746091 RepID=A0ABQ8YWG4_9EUKA|nr:hypothetical protein M0813_00059 [Anaeramoeba flamelloides]
MGIKASSYKALTHIPRKRTKDFYNLLENTNCACGLWDNNWLVSYLNQPYCDLLHIPNNKNLIGKTIDQISIQEESVMEPYQQFYQCDVTVLLKKVILEIMKYHTTEIVFTYRLFKPKFQYITAKITFRRIRIKNKLYTLVGATKINESLTINPFLTLNKMEKEECVNKIKQRKPSRTYSMSTKDIVKPSKISVHKNFSLNNDESKSNDESEQTITYTFGTVFRYSSKNSESNLENILPPPEKIELIFKNYNDSLNK